MKRIRHAAAVLAVLLLISCAACFPQPDPEPQPIAPGNTHAPDETTAPEATDAPDMECLLENALPFVLDEVYLAPKNDEEWGAPAALKVPGGEEARLILPASDEMVFDIGVIDENGVNYDAFALSLWAGDTIRLTGDWQSGTFMVTHRDGSRDFYTASVWWNAPSDRERIDLSVTDAYFTCGEAGEHTVYYKKLGASDAEKYPLLPNALETLNEGRKAKLERAARSAAGEDGEGLPVSVRETVMVYRSDSGLISLVFETRAGEGESVYSSALIDPVRGELVTPADVLTDVSVLPHLINVQLALSGSELELNEYRDHTADFAGGSKDLAFALNGSGVVIILNVNAFRSGNEAAETVTLLFKDNPFLVKPGYLLP